MERQHRRSWEQLMDENDSELKCMAQLWRSSASSGMNGWERKANKCFSTVLLSSWEIFGIIKLYLPKIHEPIVLSMFLTKQILNAPLYWVASNKVFADFELQGINWPVCWVRKETNTHCYTAHQMDDFCQTHFTCWNNHNTNCKIYDIL